MSGLRLAITLSPTCPDLKWCFEAHRQSPDRLHLQKRSRSQGPSLPRHYPASSVVRPRPTPAAAALHRRRRGRYPRYDGSPPLPASPFRRAVPTTPADRTGALVDCFPIRAAFPVLPGGSASAALLSRPAQASLTLRPVGLLNRPRRPLSRGFDQASYPAKPLVSYQSNRQFPGWNPPPLVTRAIGAHCKVKNSSL